MKQKTLLLTALVTLAAVVVLSGCGKAKPTATVPTAPSPQVPAQVTKISSITLAQPMIHSGPLERVRR